MSPDYKQAIPRKIYSAITGEISRMAVEYDSCISHGRITPVLYSIWQ